MLTQHDLGRDQKTIYEYVRSDALAERMPEMSGASSSSGGEEIMYQCFHCGSYSVVWDCDFSYEDYCMEGEGIINTCHCENCGARIEYYIDLDQEEEC